MIQNNANIVSLNILSFSYLLLCIINLGYNHFDFIFIKLQFISVNKKITLQIVFAFSIFLNIFIPYFNSVKLDIWIMIGVISITLALLVVLCTYCSNKFIKFPRPNTSKINSYLYFYNISAKKNLVF